MRVAANYNFQPTLWVNGQLQILDTAGLSSGAASGINDSGQVVGGISDTNSGEAYAALWQNGQLTKLESNMSAIAINNNGQILLTGEYAGQGGGWIWLNGTMTPVPGINGVSPGVRAMNNNGDVIGGMAISSATTYYSSFISKNGVSSLLPTFADDLADDAFAINDSDQIVGDGFNQSPGTHAIIWENGQVYDLNTLIPANSGWTLDKATAIGNDGTIVGYGTFDGQTGAFELTPTAAPSGSSSVPEPASVATLVLGGVLLLRRRRSA
jgi:probable HAF family extracellular repeat protein